MAIPAQVLAQVRMGGKKRPPKRLRKQAYPRGLEVAMTRALLDAYGPWALDVRELVLAKLPELVAEARQGRTTTDALPEEEPGATVDGGIWAGIASRAKRGWARIAEESKTVTKRILDGVADFQLAQFRAQMNHGLGVAPVLAEPWLGPATKAAATEAAALITDIGPKVITDVERVVSRGVREGRSIDTITKEVQERMGVGASRAHLIARDQVGKWNGSLNEIRQREMGVTTYTWETVKDERVRGRPGGKWPNARPSHWARQGEVFSWDKPPSDGHPGMAILCRCSSSPDLSGFFDDTGFEFKGPQGAVGGSDLIGTFAPRTRRRR